jgi:hypothetical protein
VRAQICFFVSIVFSFVAWGAVTGSLIWPELRRRGRNEALRPLLMFHSFRFIGLAFLVPGVVSADLPAAFAEGAAYGDIVAAAFALLTLALLPGRLGIVAAWVFNLWGSADIVHANYEGIHLGVQAGQLGAAYFLPTFIVPLFLITHGRTDSCFGFYYETKAKPPCRPRGGSPKVSRATTYAAPRYRQVNLLPNTASMRSN